MDQYELTRTAYRVYKKSVRQISRETRHGRKTIQKVLAGLEPKYRRMQEPGCQVMDRVSGVDLFLRYGSGYKLRFCLAASCFG